MAIVKMAMELDSETMSCNGTLIDPDGVTHIIDMPPEVMQMMVALLFGTIEGNILIDRSEGLITDVIVPDDASGAE